MCDDLYYEGFEEVHITENLLTTEERGKEMEIGGDLYTRSPHRDFYSGGTERMLSLSFRVPAISRDSLIGWRQDLSVAPAPLST